MDRTEIAILSKQTALSTDFLAEIGRITAHFALLERDLMDLTHRLLRLPEKSARAVTSELSFRAMQNLAASLVKELHPNSAESFKEILKLVGKCEEKRNQISHSLWGAGLNKIGDEKAVIRTKYSAKQQRGLVLQREEMTLNDLQLIAAEISVAAYEVEGFHADIFREGGKNG